MELDGLTTKPQPPRLTLRAEFEQTIAHYHPSDHAKRIIRGVTFAVMTGPSAAGRNTIISRMVETGKYHFVVSDTTRPKRQNDSVWEEDGKEYWFRAEGDLLRDLQAGEFLEAEIIHNQQVSGISVRELEQASREHKIAITDVDIEGIGNVLRAKSDAIALLVFPPDFISWQERLTRRGVMTTDEFRHRLTTAARIYDLPAQDDRYHIIINDTVEQAVEQARAIIERGHIDLEMREKALAIATQLRDETRAYLQRLDSVHK